MSWLFFQDESGHDHKNMPLEVRGGVAIHASRIWDFVKAMQKAEEDCFGVRLAEYGSEIKGSKLLDNKRCEWAMQEPPLDDGSRINGVKRFLTKSQQHAAPSRRDLGEVDCALSNVCGLGTFVGGTGSRPMFVLH
jgi:hypothetical protein